MFVDSFAVYGTTSEHFEGEDWLPINPKRPLNNDLWI